MAAELDPAAKLEMSLDAIISNDNSSSSFPASSASSSSQGPRRARRNFNNNRNNNNDMDTSGYGKETRARRRNRRNPYSSNSSNSFTATYDDDSNNTNNYDNDNDDNDTNGNNSSSFQIREIGAPSFLPSTNTNTSTSSSSHMIGESIPIVGARTLKVSATSASRSVAGSIAHTCRLGHIPILLAAGVSSVNIAIKAVAIARDYLEADKIDLTVKPEFRNQERGALSLHINKSELRNKHHTSSSSNANNSNDSNSELRVAQSSEPSVVAGSIAKKIRSGERVSVVSIGGSSVTTTIIAITIARRYLEGDGMDLTFRPEFIHVDMKDGESRSAIRCHVLAQQI